MPKARLFLTLCVILLLLVAASGLSSAHETVTVDGYELTFGGSDEPVITGERMWLQVEVLDADTDEPVEGLASNLTIAVQRPFGNDTFALAVDDVFGRPGWYEGAVIFTEPGTYTVYISVVIDDEPINATFKKPVHNATKLEYPERTPPQQTNTGSGFPVGFGFGAVTAAIAMTIAFVAGRTLGQ